MAPLKNTKPKPKFELAPDDDNDDAEFDQDDKALRESQPERNLDHIKSASKLSQNGVS